MFVARAFRETHPNIWLLSLELVRKCSAPWKFGLCMHAWAVAKARAMHRGRPANVLALVGDGVTQGLPHVFDASSFLDFIARRTGEGSLGMPRM